ncbi:MAG: DUF4349 domain-containing protein [Planctomycetota bacterium]|nr:DUF4349 domain-containing protein [Planctomycetota bacterium]
MTSPSDEQLERQLRSLTAPPTDSASIWRRALSEAKWSPAGRDSRTPRWKRWGAGLGVVACLGFVGVAIGVTMWPAVQEAREVAVGRSPPYIYAQDSPGDSVMASAKSLDYADGTDYDDFLGRDAQKTVDLWLLARSGGSTPKQFITPSAERTSTPWHKDQLFPDLDPMASGQRQVIRKATIELTTDDVSKAFHKAQLIVNEGLGEFVQESALTGSGETAQADLTIRVAAGRLSEVLQALRELGEVESERRGGQDVTTQVVDVEARLRNERRVETELLDLFDKRKDAPLSEVLQLRAKLGEVRREIERLTAQRDRLSRLVSLATVLVFIRTPEGQRHSDIGASAYFGEVLGSAWRRGWTFLADTVALVFSVFVGGLIWWVLIAFAILGIRRVRRRGSGG